MPVYKIKLWSTRDDASVRGTLELEIEAPDMTAAKHKVHASVPGFDWQTWTSAWGLVQQGEYEQRKMVEASVTPPKVGP